MDKNIRDTQPIEKFEDKKYGLFYVLYFLNIAVFLFGIYILFRKNILPLKYRVILTLVFVIIYMVIGKILFSKNSKRILKFIAILILVNILLINSYVIYALNRGLSVFKNISAGSNAKAEYSLVVMKNSKYNAVKDLEGIKLGVPDNIQDDKLEKVLNQIKEETKVDFETEKNMDLIRLAKNLLDGDSEVILLNESYREFVVGKYKDFSKRTRVIQKFKVEIGKKNFVPSKDVKYKESFNIYISGIDTYGDLSTVSRSDVNLILTVNPRTHKTLITSVPRDSYVRIAGDGDDEYDKLTHAGIYGIDSSIKTLENFLDININYYVKINFSSMEKIIDILGGVEVDNVEEFTSFDGHYFPKGKVILNGKKALSFSRERYALEEGEIGRGKNQERVMVGIINKLTSHSILLNYGSLLEVISNSVETNFNESKIVELVNDQIETNVPWKVKTTYVKGEDRMDLTSYAMPDYDLYMLFPYEESVKETQDLIKDTLNEK